MDGVKWFFKMFNSFPARYQTMVGIFVMEIAMVILLISTARMVWAIPFFVLGAAYEVVKRVHWGGKTMKEVLDEWKEAYPEDEDDLL